MTGSALECHFSHDRLTDPGRVGKEQAVFRPHDQQARQGIVFRMPPDVAELQAAWHASQYSQPGLAGAPDQGKQGDDHGDEQRFQRLKGQHGQQRHHRQDEIGAAHLVQMLDLGHLDHARYGHDDDRAQRRFG